MPLQALPASLRVLHTCRLPVDLLPQLTALESLGFEELISKGVEATNDLSILPTARHCPNLRTLSIWRAFLAQAEPAYNMCILPCRLCCDSLAQNVA